LVQRTAAAATAPAAWQAREQHPLGRGGRDTVDGRARCSSSIRRTTNRRQVPSSAVHASWSVRGTLLLAHVVGPYAPDKALTPPMGTKLVSHDAALCIRSRRVTGRCWRPDC
jgi:hypothetical protein